MKKTTLVLGASENPDRYANKAVHALIKNGHQVIAVGKTGGKIGDTIIEREWPDTAQVHTLTMYLNPTHQKQFYNRILALAPKRIIFNPGAENEELESLANANGIETVEACTLVLLSIGQY